jgi:hypothetical protein
MHCSYKVVLYYCIHNRAADLALMDEKECTYLLELGTEGQARADRVGLHLWGLTYCTHSIEQFLAASLGGGGATASARK